MYDTAKKAREAMKSKAKRLAGEKNEKVDSSDWSPAEPLNADVKTGMRPVSRRAYKSGGKVMGEACAPRNDRKPRKSGGVAKAKKEMAEEKSEAAEYAKAKTNRDVKAANQEREGIKHIGGLKRGGRTKREDGGLVQKMIDRKGPKYDLDYEMRVKRSQMEQDDPSYNKGQGPTKQNAENLKYSRELESRRSGRKSGGRTKKADGGNVDQLNDLMTDPEYRRELERRQNPPAPSREPARDKPASPSMDMSTMDADEAAAFMRSRKSGGRAKRASGGATSLAGQRKVEEYQAGLSKPKRGKAENYKKGGRAKGGPVAGAEEMMRSAAETSGVPSATMGFTNIKKGMLSPLRGAKKGGRIQKMGGGALMGGILPALAMGQMGDKDEGRMARKSGGRAKSSKGGTKINIMIAAGKPAGPSDMMPPPGPMAGPPPGLPIPMPGADGGSPPPMPMPMPMPMPAPAAGGTPPMGMPPGMPMPRKTGGRVTKVAKSYKDMEAGSGGGEGRLQKTDIAKTGKGAPTYKRGGKVYRSYKDMDAGAGSGEGRLEKTEIQKRKA
jgi:hypothetical protein